MPRPSRNELDRAYSVERIGLREIANRHHLSVERICQLLRTYGIPKRSVYGLASLKWPRHKLPGATLTPEQYDVVVGTLLGDAHLSDPKRSGEQYDLNSYLAIEHSGKQREYVEWKHSLLSPFSGHVRRYSREDGDRLRFQTCAHPVFTAMRNEWYLGRTKILPPAAWQITPLGLAVWYMDDGTYGFSHSPYAFLCTEGFGHDSQRAIQEILSSRFGIRASVVRTSSGGQRIRIGVDGFRRLRELVAPHIIPSLSYKLGW